MRCARPSPAACSPGEVVQRTASLLLYAVDIWMGTHCVVDGFYATQRGNLDLVGGIGGEALQRPASLLLHLRVIWGVRPSP